ncbi:XdhC family protein [Microbulbifer halophilus]|uniref:XdhC family protein n=1 Tax=Microbulbifer halophilus TaxID=453963 RepID=A0ABW5ED62_9GAMM|nr:XdhC family protein [Microbulbifer halophilus]MCW8125679.1 XdhC family protein [Microbulbifer halophilus]
MANQLHTLLDLWHEQKNARNWVLGTIYKTIGPCYRKAGAIMLFDDMGRHYGLLSGGCLEADIQRHAQRVMNSGEPKTLCYDGSDEDDFAFQLGIGCGGTVHILLQPLNADNDFLQLEQLRAQLRDRRHCHYLQKIPAAGESAAEISTAEAPDRPARAQLIERTDGQWLQTPIAPVPHILLMGAGADAQPMAQLFRTQGWQVSLCDPRPANGRAAYFPDCTGYRCHPDDLSTQLDLRQVDAAVVMNHNLELDAAALRALYLQPLEYLGLLGPVSRRDRVLEQAGLTLEQLNASLATPLRAPVGLNLGGEVPESIALSTCAELHAALHGADAGSLSPADTMKSDKKTAVQA